MDHNEKQAAWPPGTHRLQSLLGPESLAGLASVLFTLSEVTVLARSIEEAPGDLIAELELVSAAVPPVPAQRETVHGLIDRFPLYAAMSQQPNGAEEHRALRQLQAVSLVCHGLILGRTLDESVRSTFKTAGRAIRRLHLPAMSDRLRPIFIAETPGSLSSVLDRLTAVLAAEQANSDPGSTQPRHVDYIEALIRLTRYAVGDRSPRTRSSAESSAINIEVRRHTHENSDLGVAFEVLEPLPRRAQDAKVEAGASPHKEGPSPKAVGMTLVAPGKTPSSSPRTKNLERVHQKRALRTHFQWLPLGLDRLQDLDVHYLLRGFSAEPVLDGPGVMVLASLLTGCGSSTLKECTVIRDLRKQPPNFVPPGRLTLCRYQKCWLLQPPALKGAFTTKSGEEPLYEPTGPMFIPLPKGFPGTEALWAHANLREGQLLFPDLSSDGGERQMKEWLSERSRRTPAQLSLKRVESFLSSRIFDLTSDRAEAGLFTDDADSGGAAARMYYYAPPAQRMVDHYISIFDAVHQSGSPAAQLDWRWRSLDEPPLVEVAKTFRVGSKGVPVLEKIKSVVAGLILKTERLRAGRPTPSKAIAFHNAYVSYITLRVMWESGIRAVVDPIEFFLLDLDAGLLAVADKDFEEEATPRLAPLTPQAQEQLRLYNRHRVKLITYLASAGVSMAPSTWLFFIENNKCCEVRPASLTRQLGADYPFRMNAQRHFIRTRLIDLGAQPGSVDALLGHGGLGEEPYGPYSCFSFSDFQRTLCPKIVELSEMVGWKVIKPVSIGESS